MAFKTLKDFNEERYGNMFLLREDGDYADVIFLYQSEDDVLVADTHYIKSTDYSGYVHCCGKRCPACMKGIRVQTKLFIPMYNITDDEIQFWDRNSRFIGQLQKDVLSRCSNPSEYVFRITRHGESGSVDTKYEIKAIGRNSTMSYSDILKRMNVTFPDYYSHICKEYNRDELEEIINMPSPSENSSYEDVPEYSVSPRPNSSGVSSRMNLPEDGFSDVPALDDMDSPYNLNDPFSDEIPKEEDDDVDF